MRYPWMDKAVEPSADNGFEANAEVIALTHELQFALLAALAGSHRDTLPARAANGFGRFMEQPRLTDMSSRQLGERAQDGPVRPPHPGPRAH